nr:MAG TPA: helix-turn-helix domain protein [Caudoviricetes sp.]
MKAAEAALAAGLKPKLAYTVSETAAYIGIPERTLYEEVKAGRMRSVVPRGRTRGAVIRPEDVDRWVRENTVGQD